MMARMPTHDHYAIKIRPSQSFSFITVVTGGEAALALQDSSSKVSSSSIIQTNARMLFRKMT